MNSLNNAAGGIANRPRGHVEDDKKPDSLIRKAGARRGPIFCAHLHSLRNQTGARFSRGDAFFRPAARNSGQFRLLILKRALVDLRRLISRRDFFALARSEFGRGGNLVFKEKLWPRNCFSRKLAKLI